MASGPSSAAPLEVDAPVGAYGLRLEGVEGARAFLVPAGDAWPRIELVRRPGLATSQVERVDDTSARLLLRNGGEIAIDRAEGRAVFTVPEEVSDEALVHPYLAPVAAVVGRWLGRESFHGGAVAVGGAVWGLLGERESGKSSTLALLAARGVPVVCDDMLVLDGLAPFAGPRTVDLRGDAAERLGLGEPLGVVGARERWRLRLGPLPPGLRLAGWFFLGWGERLEVRPVPPAERIGRLVEHLGVRLPSSDPAALLELASLPALELRRPRGWHGLDDAADRLLDAAAG